MDFEPIKNQPRRLTMPPLNLGPAGFPKLAKPFAPRLALLLALVCVCLFIPALASAALAVGDEVPIFAALDQHGKEYQFTNGPAFLLVAKDMAASKIANQKLAEQGAGFLEQQQAVYVLDIHTMPAIARVFAFPKLRKYPQRLILVDAAETLAPFPAEAGRITVLSLTPERKIKAIRFWDPASAPVAAVLK